MPAPKYLPILATVLALASLGAASTLSALGIADAKTAWEAFLGFAAFLIGVHVPGPGAGA